jgi:hypothetical protein
MSHRTAFIVTAAAALVAGLAAPASATIDIRDRWSESSTDTFSDCGIESIEIAHEAHGTFTARALRDSDGQAWLGHNNYTWEDHFRNPANGRSFSLGANGNWREVRGTHLDGDIWAFDWKDSGATFVLRDQSGSVVWRDRGTISGRDVIDTLGDGEVGGEYLSSDLTSLKGQFKEFRWCEDIVQTYLG